MISIQIQLPKYAEKLVEKYGFDHVYGAFAQELQFHADNVSKEQIKRIIKNDMEYEQESEA